jgi:hypothetical protein
MKNLFLSAFILLSVVSCDSKKSKVENDLRKIVDSTFDDPKSYEFIEAIELDTLGLQKQIQLQEMVIKASKSIIGNCNFMIQNGNLNDVVIATKKKAENLKDLEVDKDKLIKLQDFKSGKTLKIIHKYRAKNKDGALILKIDTVYIKK